MLAFPRRRSAADIPCQIGWSPTIRLQNRALAAILAACLTSSSSESRYRFSLGHNSEIGLIRIVPPVVRAAFPKSDSSEPYPRYNPGYVPDNTLCKTPQGGRREAARYSRMGRPADFPWQITTDFHHPTTEPCYRYHLGHMSDIRLLRIVFPL